MLLKKNIIQQGLAIEILKPVSQRIVNAISSAFDDFLKIKKTITSLPTYVDSEGRTNACIIHDCIKSHITAEFADDSDIVADVWNGIFALKINDDLFIRFNKIDKNLSSLGYPTNQSKNYLNQLQIEGFPEDPTFLYGGYQCDSIWSKITALHINCWEGRSLHWTLDLINDFAISNPTLFELPAIELSQERRVRVKTNNSDENIKTGTD